MAPKTIFGKIQINVVLQILRSTFHSETTISDAINKMYYGTKTVYQNTSKDANSCFPKKT